MRIKLLPSRDHKVREEKVSLNPETAASLGKVSAELAWLQFKTLVQQAIQEYPDQVEQYAKKVDLRLNLSRLTAMLEATIPEDGLNLLNLSNLMALKPISAFQAAADILSRSDMLQRRD